MHQMREINPLKDSLPLSFSALSDRRRAPIAPAVDTRNETMTIFLRPILSKLEEKTGNKKVPNVNYILAIPEISSLVMYYFITFLVFKTAKRTCAINPSKTKNLKFEQFVTFKTRSQ